MTIRHLFDRDDTYIISIDHRPHERRQGWRNYGAEHLQWADRQASIEWSILNGKGHGLGIEWKTGTRGSENKHQLAVFASRLGSVWISERGFLPAWTTIRNSYESRITGIRLSRELGLDIYIWAPRNSWSRDEPWWWRFSIRPRDLLGKNRTEKTTLDAGTCSIPMPEKNYDAVWCRVAYTNWYTKPLGQLRDRALGPRTHTLIKLEVDGGIPVPGKGENSWDIDDDAIYGQSSSARSVEDAIGSIVASALRTRRNYGGEHMNTPTAGGSK